jgi:SAM-dependent methyltransferase
MAVALDAACSGLYSQWGVDWRPESLTERLEALRPLVSRGVNGPAQFARTVGKMPKGKAPLAGLLLSPKNLRALVDHCRTTPESRRVPGVPTALAFAFDPRRASRYITEKDALQQSDDHHDYVSLDPETFAERLFACGGANRAGAFLDVGCGTGEKAFLAYALGGFDAADGLEYDPKTVAVAEYLLHGAATKQPYPIRVFCQDALEFARYGAYDVVYMYGAMKSTALMRRLVARIANQMKVGAILMDVLKATTALRKTATGFVTLARPGAKGPWEWTVEAELDALLEYW